MIIFPMFVASTEEKLTFYRFAENIATRGSLNISFKSKQIFAKSSDKNRNSEIAETCQSFSISRYHS